MASSDEASPTDSAKLQTRLAIGGFMLSAAGVALAAATFLVSFVVTPLWRQFHEQADVTFENVASAYSDVRGDASHSGWESDSATIVNNTDHAIGVLWAHVWQQPTPFRGEPDDSGLTEMRPRRGKPFDGQHPVLVRPGRGLSVFADRFWARGVPPLPDRWKHSEGDVSFEVVTDDGKSWVERVSAHRVAFPYEPQYPDVDDHHSIGVRSVVLLLAIVMLVVGVALRRADARRLRARTPTE